MTELEIAAIAALYSNFSSLDQLANDRQATAVLRVLHTKSQHSPDIPLQPSEKIFIRLSLTILHNQPFIKQFLEECRRSQGTEWIHTLARHIETARQFLQENEFQLPPEEILRSRVDQFESLRGSIEAGEIRIPEPTTDQVEQLNQVQRRLELEQSGLLPDLQEALREYRRIRRAAGYTGMVMDCGLCQSRNSVYWNSRNDIGQCCVCCSQLSREQIRREWRDLYRRENCDYCGCWDSVGWNPNNGVVQCHNCGHAYSPPEPGTIQRWEITFHPESSTRYVETGRTEILFYGNSDAVGIQIPFRSVSLSRNLLEIQSLLSRQRFFRVAGGDVSIDGNPVMGLLDWYTTSHSDGLTEVRFTVRLTEIRQEFISEEGEVVLHGAAFPETGRLIRRFIAIVAPLNYTPRTRPQPQPEARSIPLICQRCRFAHGRTYGGNMLVCGIHPYGSGEDCSDFEGV